MRIASVLIVSALLTFTAMVGPWATPALAQTPECTGDVVITITFDPDPVFDWEPQCALTLLLIEPVGSGEDTWAIESNDVNEIAPPIEYGVAPIGVEEDPAATLIPGESYSVYLYRLWGPTNEEWAFAGTAEFTAPQKVNAKPTGWTTLKVSFR